MPQLRQDHPKHGWHSFEEMSVLRGGALRRARAAEAGSRGTFFRSVRSVRPESAWCPRRAFGSEEYSINAGGKAIQVRRSHVRLFVYRLRRMQGNRKAQTDRSKGIVPTLRHAERTARSGMRCLWEKASPRAGAHGRAAAFETALSFDVYHYLLHLIGRGFVWK